MILLGILYNLVVGTPETFTIIIQKLATDTQRTRCEHL